VLTENNLDWYKSFSFFEGCKSHIQHLKRVVAQPIATEIFEHEEALELEVAY
jgi:hypothetical protein